MQISLSFRKAYFPGLNHYLAESGVVDKFSGSFSRSLKDLSWDSEVVLDLEKSTVAETWQLQCFLRVAKQYGVQVFSFAKSYKYS